MFTINNNIITLCRADSTEFSLFINCGTEIELIRYELTEYDTVYFAIMKPNQPFELAVVKKEYNYESPKTKDGDLILSIDEADTEFLCPGLYYYSIKMKTVDKNNPEKYNVTTIVSNTKFYIID